MNRSLASRIIAPFVLLLGCGGCGVTVERSAEPIRLGGFEPWAEPIPDALVDQLRAAEEYGKGLGVMGQMLYAMFALSLYDRDPSADWYMAVDDDTLIVRSSLMHLVRVS